MFQQVDKRWWKICFWCLWSAATALMVLPTPDLPAINLWDKGWHAMTFAALMLLAWLGYRDRHSPLQLASLLLAYGVGIECIQFFIPSRSFSILDMLADSTGIFPVCVAVMKLGRR